MADRIQLRRDTKANWEQYNPILLEGEPGHVLDYPNLYKMGDGVHAWNDLPYRGYNGTVTSEVQNNENSVPSGAAVYSALKDPSKGFVENTPKAKSDKIVNSDGLWRGAYEYNESLNIVKDTFYVQPVEHSSLLDPIDISRLAGGKVKLRLSTATATLDPQVRSISIRIKDVNLNEISSRYIDLDQDVEFTLPDNAYYVTYYVYKITSAGYMSVVARLVDTLLDAQKDISEISERVDSINPSGLELNISQMFPTGGIDGTNKYNLAGAIAKVPNEYKVPNITLCFINESNYSTKYRLILSSWTENVRYWFDCSASYGKIGISDGTLNINTTTKKIETWTYEQVFFGYGTYVIKPASTVLSCDIYAESSSLAQIITNGIEMKPISYTTPIPDGYCMIAIIQTNYTTDLEQKKFVRVIWSGSNCTVDGKNAFNSGIMEEFNRTNSLLSCLGYNLGEIGIYSYSFVADSTEHSSLKDIYTVDIPSGSRLTGVLSLGTAQMQQTTTPSVSVKLFNENGGVVHNVPINVGEEFEITVSQRITAVSFYIYRISTYGTFNVFLNANALEKLEEKIVSEVELDKIPAYFEENIAAVKTAAMKDIGDSGINGENFIFITDMHWENNARNSPKLIKKLTNEICIGNIVFGGDVINGQANQDTAREYFSAVYAGLSVDKTPLVAAFGNHDYNANDGGVAFSNGDKTFYALLQKGNDYRCKEATGQPYFYFDNLVTNTRFIVLSTHSDSLNTNQETWLTALLNSTSNDMHIIIIMHRYISEQSVYESETWIGYNFSISTSGNSLNTILENTNKKVEVIIAGHLHLDYNGCTPGMIPVVLSDCDTRQSVAWPQTLGTKNEQSFDIITINYDNKTIKCRRVGRGKSRIVHYNAYNLNVGGTLDISSLLEIVPTSYSIRDNINFQYRTTTGVTFNGTLASIDTNGVVTAVSSGIVTAVAENDDCIETFNIKIAVS